MSFIRRSTSLVGLGILLGILICSPGEAAEFDASKVRGYVDKSVFTGLVGDDDLQVEIWLPGSLLQLAGAFDEGLKELVGGLELAQAVVVEAKDPAVAARLAERARSTEKQLLKKGWVRLAKIKDGSESVSVLVLTAGETIHGLVVMVVDSSEGGEFIFANVAGVIDLAALQRLGSEMSLPGLDKLELEP